MQILKQLIRGVRVRGGGVGEKIFPQLKDVLKFAFLAINQSSRVKREIRVGGVKHVLCILVQLFQSILVILDFQAKKGKRGNKSGRGIHMCCVFWYNFFSPFQTYQTSRLKMETGKYQVSNIPFFILVLGSSKSENSNQTTIQTRVETET